MPTNFTFFLAWRYIRGIHGTIGTMVRVCAIGIVVSTGALALTMAVMRGFEVAMEEKLQGIHAQIIVRAYGNGINLKNLGELFTAQFPQIRAWAPQDTRHVMLQKIGADGVGDVMMLKGIDPLREAQVSVIGTKIVSGSALTTLAQPQTIMIGKKKADELELKAGDLVHLLYPPEEQQGKKITFDQTTVRITGIFETGVEEYDLGVLFCSLRTLREWFTHAAATQVGIKLTPGSSLEEVLTHLRHELPNLEIYSWKDLYPALISATTLERIIMFLILSLMGLIATLNIIALLFMQIIYKRPDIALLTALGCPRRRIAHIFLTLGMLIALSATTLGLLLAYLACRLLQSHPFITLPDVYYTTHIPAVIEWPLFALVFLVSMALSFLATWYPVRSTYSLNVATILRQEG